MTCDACDGCRLEDHCQALLWSASQWACSMWRPKPAPLTGRPACHSWAASSVGCSCGGGGGRGSWGWAPTRTIQSRRWWTSSRGEECYRSVLQTALQASCFSTFFFWFILVLKIGCIANFKIASTKLLRLVISPIQSGSCNEFESLSSPGSANHP